MAEEVWRDTGKGFIEYIPSADGAFEKWMEERDPGWMLGNSCDAEWWREIWEAATAYAQTHRKEL